MSREPPDRLPPPGARRHLAPVDPGPRRDEHDPARPSSSIVVGCVLLRRRATGWLEHRVARSRRRPRARPADRAQLDAVLASSRRAAPQQDLSTRWSTRGPPAGSRSMRRAVGDGRPADRRRREGHRRASTCHVPGARAAASTRRLGDGPDLRRIRPTLGVAGLPGARASSSAASCALPADGDTSRSTTCSRWTSSSKTLDLVRRALLLGGVAMVLMVGGVAWLVSRQVLDPVRLARRIAERLAAGSSSSACTSSGEDDIARLATSFNQMAGQPAEPDPPARGALPAAAALRLRRLARAPHAAHDRADGQRGAPRRAAVSTRRPAAAAELLKGARPLRDAARRPARPQPLRRRRGKARARHVDLGQVARRVVDITSSTRRAACGPARRVARAGVVEADVRRIERIVRNLVTNASDHAESRDVEMLRRPRRAGPRSPCVTSASGLAAASPLVFDRFWRADPRAPDRAAPVWASRSRGRTRPCTAAAAGMGPARRGASPVDRAAPPGGQLRHSPLPLVPDEARETTSTAAGAQSSRAVPSRPVPCALPPRGPSRCRPTDPSGSRRSPRPRTARRARDHLDRARRGPGESRGPDRRGLPRGDEGGPDRDDRGPTSSSTGDGRGTGCRRRGSRSSPTRSPAPPRAPARPAESP